MSPDKATTGLIQMGEADDIPAELKAQWRKYLEPVPPETVCAFLGRALDLTDESADKGFFRVDRRPYMRRPLELHKDDDCRNLTLCFGPQTGKSIVFWGGRFYRWRVKGKSSVIALPNIGFARRTAKTRLLPWLRKSKVMQEIVPGKRHAVTALEQYFTNCHSIIVGSNSPANLSGQPVPDTGADEIEKMDRGSEKETRADYLLAIRCMSFPDSFSSWTSTPSDPKGPIWELMNAGTFEVYKLRCPGCGKPHHLTHDQFRYPADARTKTGKPDLRRIINETWHECPHLCGYRFTNADLIRLYSEDAEKFAAYPDRKEQFTDLDRLYREFSVWWEPTNDEAMPGNYSFHLPSWYSPDVKCTFGACQVQWLIAVASGDVTQIQKYFTNVKAEPFDVTTWGNMAITDLPKGGYEMGDHWDGAMIHLTSGEPVRIMIYDRQQDKLIGVCRTLGADMSTRLYWSGEVPTFDEGELKAKELGCQVVGMDCSYKMQDSLDECDKRGWIPFRGENLKGYREILAPDAANPKGSIVTRIYDWRKLASASRGPVNVLHFASQGAQTQLACLISGKFQGWTICRTPPENYAQEMRSHEYVSKKGKAPRWQQIGERPDHRWDCETMMAVWLQADGLTPAAIEE